MTTRQFNIADLFEIVADTVADRTALVCGERRVSFGELEQRANRFAHFLQSRGIGVDDHVGLYLYNGNEYLEAMLGCFKVRAVPINVNYRYVRDELEYIFNNAQLAGCVHNREFVPHIADIAAGIDRLRAAVAVDDGTREDLAAIDAIDYEQALAGQSSARDFGERSDDDLFILYTGGTTGMPKGVMWPHRSVFFAALGGGGFMSADGPCREPADIADRIMDPPLVGMALAPLMHGASWWYACIQLLAGNTVVLNPDHGLDAERVWDIVEAERVNAVTIVGDAMAVPLLDALERNPGRWQLDAVINVGSGGAVFSESCQDKFRGFLPNVFITNSFGSSEGGAMGMDSGRQKGKSGLGNVARNDFMDVIIDDDDEPHRHAKPGEMGIFARSGHIPIGYYNDPEKTAKTFVEVDGKTWLLTGDAAQMEDDGSITVFGRGSNCINSGGEKVFPEEVEQALKEHPDIADALVIGMPDDRWGSRVVAVVAARGGKVLTLDDVQQVAGRHIARYKLPRELHLVDEIPRAPSGKPNYPRAREIALGGDCRAV